MPQHELIQEKHDHMMKVFLDDGDNHGATN